MKSTILLKIGIAYDTSSEYEEIRGTKAGIALGLTTEPLPSDFYAEFEPESTISIMEEAIRLNNAEPVRVGGPLSLLKSDPKVDVIWNIAEGIGSRNREAWVPNLCELYGIPYLGSDGFTLTQSLDKAETKRIARDLDIPTSEWFVLSDENSAELPPDAPGFPLFLKPRFEGTGKGIGKGNIVHTSDELFRVSAQLRSLYKQDVLVERHLPGAEFTVAVSGSPLTAHPVLERGVDQDSGIGVHVVGSEMGYNLTNQINSELEEKLQNWSVKLCEKMQVLDYARLDFKMDSSGNPYLLEINPLPTFATDNTFAILAELEGKPYSTFLAGILESALNRVFGKSIKSLDLK